jgi:hypothetical protein
MPEWQNLENNSDTLLPPPGVWVCGYEPNSLTSYDDVIYIYFWETRHTLIAPPRGGTGVPECHNLKITRIPSSPSRRVGVRV